MISYTIIYTQPGVLLKERTCLSPLSVHLVGEAGEVVQWYDWRVAGDTELVNFSSLEVL